MAMSREHIGGGGAVRIVVEGEGEGVGVAEEKRKKLLEIYQYVVNFLTIVVGLRFGAPFYSHFDACVIYTIASIVTVVCQLLVALHPTYHPNVADKVMEWSVFISTTAVLYLLNNIAGEIAFDVLGMWMIYAIVKELRAFPFPHVPTASYLMFGAGVFTGLLYLFLIGELWMSYSAGIFIGSVCIVGAILLSIVLYRRTIGLGAGGAQNPRVDIV